MCGPHLLSREHCHQANAGAGESVSPASPPPPARTARWGVCVSTAPSTVCGGRAQTLLAERKPFWMTSLTRARCDSFGPPPNPSGPRTFLRVIALPGLGPFPSLALSAPQPSPRELVPGSVARGLGLMLGLPSHQLPDKYLLSTFCVLCADRRESRPRFQGAHTHRICPEEARQRCPGYLPAGEGGSGETRG